jgi:hypothetical protein
MDRNVDLTLNRDFRNRGKSYSIPRSRSIFKRDGGLNILSNGSIPSYIVNTGTITNSWTVLNSTSTSMTLNTINYRYGEECDRCGKDITKLPWHQDLYGCLCKKCKKILDTDYGSKKIPWK